jgi:hypothetical protein
VGACQKGGLILLADAFGVVGDGLAHEVVMLFPAGEFFAFVEDLGVDLDLFVFVGDEEVLAGRLGHPLLRVQLLDALQTSLVALVFVLDTVELHYPHGCFIYNIQVNR